MWLANDFTVSGTKSKKNIGSISSSSIITGLLVDGIKSILA
jgi:hypothetical protein